MPSAVLFFLQRQNLFQGRWIAGDAGALVRCKLARQDARRDRVGGQGDRLQPVIDRPRERDGADAVACSAFASARRVADRGGCPGLPDQAGIEADAFENAGQIVVIAQRLRNRGRPLVRFQSGLQRRCVCQIGVAIRLDRRRVDRRQRRVRDEGVNRRGGSKRRAGQQSRRQCRQQFHRHAPRLKSIRLPDAVRASGRCATVSRASRASRPACRRAHR